MPIILSTSNIIIDYGTSNFTMETVKTSPFIQKDTVGTTSNLLAEPFVDTVSRMYPPSTSRSFVNNNLTLSNTYIASIACGWYHTVFLTNNGKVYSCGQNNEGQLGRTVDTANPASTPSQITTNIGSLTISAIACGAFHTVFLTNNGKVYSCGRNNLGQLGQSTSTTTPSIISNGIGSLTISAVACGIHHTIFLANNGTVFSCGYNYNGQLGRTEDTANPASTPSQIYSLGGISAIACGGDHTVFLTNYGKVYSCGRYNEGQLGQSTSVNPPAQIENSIGSLTISAIACGYFHSLFLTNNGKVYATGSNSEGQLGLQQYYFPYKTIPQEITYLNSFTISSIACGYSHSLFRTNNGKVYSCGWDYFGQLGRTVDTANPVDKPSQITTNIGSLTISAITCTYGHSAFLTNDGKGYTVGNNSNGQLGRTVSWGPISLGTALSYGLGTYTVSYSSFTASSEPYRCFNDTSSVNNAAQWAVGNYTTGTGAFNKTFNLVSGYNGDWVRIQLPVSIKLRSFAIKQISTALNRAPKNFRFYGSTNGTSWVPIVDKTNAVYTNLFYAHTDMSEYASNTNQFYNHFGIVVNSLLGTSETTLSFDELYIYGSEQVTFTRSVVNSTNKLLSFTLLYGLSNYPNSDLGYNITFPTPTFVNSISTSTNLILRGDYILNILNSSSSQLIPNGGQTNIVNIGTLNLPTTNVQVNYHLLNPLINNSESAQWTYSPIDTSVYHLGNVGIMTKTPSYQLEINNNIYVSGTAFTGSSQTNWVILSDKRIKENIVKASYETCFENVKNIELYRFNFKANTVNNNDFNQLGFIAQEVRNIFPKAVEVNMIQDNNGIIPDLLTLNITQIKYTLYGAVKYLLEKIEKLERNLELKNRAYTGTLDRTLYFQGNNIGTLDFQGSNIEILDYRGNNIGTLDFQ